MFLTKLKLDKFNINVLNCLRDAQLMHSTIMKLFRCSRQDAGVIYRIDEKNFTIYMISKIMPDFNFISNGFTCENYCNIDKIVNSFSENQVYRFSIYTYPNVQFSGKRKYISDKNEQIKWLERTANKNGFSVFDVVPVELGTVSGTHNQNDGGKFYFRKVSFSGVLRIVDKNLFIKSFKNGIGRGLSYGLGMLLVTN